MVVKQVIKKTCPYCFKEFTTTSNVKIYCESKCRQNNYYFNCNNIDRYRERQKKYAREKIREKLGLPVDTPRLRAPNGSGTIHPAGYKIITKKGHPNSHKSGRIFEHIYIMSEHIGRPLRKDESIHHKNGIRHDNRIENLELKCGHHGKGQKVEDIIEWAKSAFKDYGYEVVRRQNVEARA